MSLNVVTGILFDLDKAQEVTIKQFPSIAPVQWDQKELANADIVIVIGNPA